MSQYQIFSDSSCDIPQDILKNRNIKTVPFYTSFDEEKYEREIEELSISDFYKKLTSSKVYPKTSLPSIEDYTERFKKVLAEGFDILCICITSKFSGSYQAACLAKENLKAEFPNRKIAIIDSQLATGVQGLLVLEAVKMRDNNVSLKEAETKLNQIKSTGHIFFTIGTLTYLQRGGRIGKVASLLGNVLSLKPLIILKDGELFPAGKVIGRAKSLEKVIEMFDAYFKKNNLNFDDYEFAALTGNETADTEKVKKSVEQIIGRKIDNPTFTIGTTIGTYTGPDTVAMCIMRKYNR